MQTTFFASVFNPAGWQSSFDTFEDFFHAELKSPEIRSDKDGRLVSLNEYEGNHRNLANIRAIHGCVLDFDNSSAAGKCIPQPDTIDTIANELEGLTWAAHTSFSNKPTFPKFRILIPFAFPISREEFSKTFEAIVEKLGNPPGLDYKTSKNAACCYYLPACPEERKQFFHSELNEGKLLNPYFYDPEAEKLAVLAEEAAQKKAINVIQAGASYGRNNALKAQVSACLEKGKSFEETCSEIVAYDAEYHNPPLFTDSSEGFLEHSAEAGAAKFVAQIWFSHARNYKAVPKLSRDPIIEIVDIPAELAESPKKRKLFHLSKRLLESTPGLVGELAGWITETAQKPQPVLSLGAALAAVGTLKGHRVQTDTGLRTNLYLLGLGPSGSGKEHPSRMIQLLFSQTDNELLLSGEPASDSGLLKSMKVNRGRTLILWDEIGHALASLTAGGAAAHERKIIKLLMALFTKANSKFQGKEYANHDGKANRFDLDQPCLSIFGTTVAERLYQALTSDYAVDGFLPRFLIMQVENPDVPESDCHFVEDVPEELKKRVFECNFLPVNVRSTGNLDKDNNIRPAIIGFADGFAKRRALECRAEFARRRTLSREDGSGLDAIFNRGYEHLMKLALVVTDGPAIEERAINWANEVVTTLLESSCYCLTEYVSENDFERKMKRVIDIIRYNPGISHSTLIRRTQFAANERRRILEDVIESETVLVSVDKAPGQGRNGRKYFLNR